MLHRFNANGFSMIELVLVLTALSLLVVSLAPQHNLGNINVEAAAQRLEQDLRYARELAVTKRILCGLQIQSNGNSIIYEGTPASPTLNPLTRQPYSYNLNNDFKNVQFQNVMSTLVIEFNNLGTPVQGGGTTLQVGNTQSTISLVVTANTGLVRRL